MTVVKLLGSDKRHIKASSNIHPSFYFVLSDFYQEYHTASMTRSAWNHNKGPVILIANYTSISDIYQGSIRPKKVTIGSLWRQQNAF